MITLKSNKAIVIGTGPNGLAAAVTLARAGLTVECLEANPHYGGGASTRELTLPGYLHDLGSSIHPMALVSPLFRALGLTDSVTFTVPDVSYAHVLRNSTSVLCHRDLDATARDLGHDGALYRSIMAPLAEHAATLAGVVLRNHPGRLSDVGPLASFGLRTLYQGTPTYGLGFTGDRAPALLSGVAAHTIGTHPHVIRAATGLMLNALAHSVGWPVPRGGSQAISDALAADLHAHGGTITTSAPVDRLEQVADADIVMFDTSPHEMVRIAGSAMPQGYTRRLDAFRYGPGIAVVHFALAGPIPWSSPDLAEAPTLHLGGSRADMAAAGRDVAAGRLPAHPYILLVQPTRWDPTRAPAGHATVQAYCHVPHGYPHDLANLITNRIDQLAPGFTDLVIGRHSYAAKDLAQVSRNFVGGDFGAGAMSLTQLFTRPVASVTPWRTPTPGLYLCSSSTPPGPAVHGMAGYNAAKTALRDAGIRHALEDI